MKTNKIIKANPTKLSDTVSMMNSDDWKERQVGEYWQLRVRYEKLKVICEKYKDGTLDFSTEVPLVILEKQRDLMHQYLCILELRGEMEKIKY